MLASPATRVQVGTLKKPGADDDEFDYAFDGGKREQDFHKQVRHLYHSSSKAKPWHAAHTPPLQAAV